MKTELDTANDITKKQRIDMNALIIQMDIKAEQRPDGHWYMLLPPFVWDKLGVTEIDGEPIPAGGAWIKNDTLTRYTMQQVIDCLDKLRKDKMSAIAEQQDQDDIPF